MDKDTLIRNLAMLMAGLQVPVSMEMNLGRAAGAWAALHRELGGFGWKDADDYERALREKLGLKPVQS